MPWGEGLAETGRGERVRDGRGYIGKGCVTRERERGVRLFVAGQVEGERKHL